MSVITLDNGKTSIQVNGLLVATGITRAGLSVREVARRCGVTFNIIYRITRDDEYSADLPIRHLAQLAQLLDHEHNLLAHIGDIPVAADFIGIDFALQFAQVDHGAVPIGCG